MSAAYASPPRSTGDAPSPDAFPALSQAPPPSIREILGAYSLKGEGDRDLLVALLNAKSAEDQRIAAVAALQQTVLQMQHSLALARTHAASPSVPLSPPPMPEAKRSRAPTSSTRRSPSSRQSSASPTHRTQSAYTRPHPYARPGESYSERQTREWAQPRRTWTSMSSERSTSEEGSERE